MEEMGRMWCDVAELGAAMEKERLCLVLLLLILSLLAGVVVVELLAVLFSMMFAMVMGLAESVSLDSRRTEMDEDRKQ